MKFKLGQKVKFSKATIAEYSEFRGNDYRNLVPTDYPSTKEREGIIVRKTMKITGKLTPRSKGSYSPFSEYEFEPGYLSEKHYHSGYEVAFNLNRKPVFVLPEDLESLE